MTRPTVVIIGAGFAGLSAAKTFARHPHRAKVILIDKYENSHFRPLIPDVVSRSVHPQRLLYPLLPIEERYGFSFVCEPVVNIDFQARRVECLEQSIPYDFLILATGSQTPLPPAGTLRENALRLDSVHDANRLRELVINGSYKRFLVCGGGYTGVEIASNLQKLILDRGMNKKVIIAEMVDTLLSTLPAWMQQYVFRDLEHQGVQIRLSAKVEDLSGQQIHLSNGEQIDDALCIWTTGLAASSLSKNLDIDKEKGGRVVVDRNLRFREECFAAGDCASFEASTGVLRMSVQFSLDQGRVAANNVMAAIKGKKPERFTPVDPGFIIPLASGKSCGEVFGVRTRGRSATLLHYLLSIYRSRGAVNRLGVARGALRACPRF